MVVPTSTQVGIVPIVTKLACL